LKKKQKKKKKGVSTCGRYVILRIKMKHLNEHQFAKIFTKGKYTSDEVAVLLTV